MREIDLSAPSPELRLTGVLDLAATGDGFQLRRLPPGTRAQLLDPSAEFMATMPSGAKIELRTDTQAIEVVARLTHLQLGDFPPIPGMFELSVDGGATAAQASARGDIVRVDLSTGTFELLPGEVTTVRFDDLPAGWKHIELWLPHATSVELRAVRVDDDAAIEPPPRPNHRWVHYGSSISHCLEAVQPTHVWPVVASRLAGVELQSLAFAGQCQIDQYVARAIRDMPADAISLKVGINIVNGDTMRERTFVAAVQGFIDTVRDGHPETPLAVVTPIICPAAEDHPGPTLAGSDLGVRVIDRPPELSVGALTLRRIRELLADVVAARQRAGDSNIGLIDGLELFGPDDVDDLPDGLHPNDAGYVRIGERFHGLAFGPGGLFEPVAAAGRR